MNNQEIEKLLVSLIDDHLKDKENSLSFTSKDDHGIFWDNNIWFLKSKDVHPIALLIFDEAPERCKDGDDDYIIATFAKIIGQSPNWVLSFQDGWSGKSNKATSINGYLLGRSLRIKYFKS